MKFCRECGASLSEGAAFCKECGTSTDREVASTTSHHEHTSQMKKPLSTKKKIWIAASLLVIGIAIGGYKIGESLTNKERMLEKFQTALMEQNEEAVANRIVSTDKRLEINKDSVKGIMQLIEENPDSVQGIMSTLYDQSEYYDLKNRNKKWNTEYEDQLLNQGFFNLKKSGRTFFLYDKYEITVKPVYVSIYTNYKDTELKIDGVKVAKADIDDFSKKVGPYLPGYYTVEATLSNSFVKNIEKEREILITTEDQVIDMYLEADEITLDTNFREMDIIGELLINGEKTGINPFTDQVIGPVLIDGSQTLQVVANMPWGELKSDELVIDNAYLGLRFSQDEHLQKAIFDTIVLHAKEWSVAYTSGDTTKMTTNTVSQNEELASEITNAKEYGEFYKGAYLGTIFDLDSINVYSEDNQWKAAVTVQELYHSDVYYEGQTPDLSDNELDKDYTLVYDVENKKWLVENMSNSWFFNDQVEHYEHKEEQPEELTTVWSK